MQVKIAET